MPLADFDGPLEWARDLDNRWPERLVLKTTIVDVITAEVARSKRDTPKILELGIGAGEVLESLARALPRAALAGIDLQPSLITYVSGRVPGCSLFEHDLNDDAWSDSVDAPFDFVYSLQSFHDLGGRKALENVYRRIFEALEPGGVIINVDFVEPQAHDDPADPRRFPVDVHRDCLSRIGYVEFRCVRREGQLACMSARRAGGNRQIA